MEENRNLGFGVSPRRFNCQVKGRQEIPAISGNPRGNLSPFTSYSPAIGPEIESIREQEIKRVEGDFRKILVCLSFLGVSPWLHFDRHLRKYEFKWKSLAVFFSICPSIFFGLFWTYYFLDLGKQEPLLWNLR